MAAVNENRVRLLTRQLLQTVNLETTNEKQIREKVAAKLGLDLDAVKALVNSEVQMHLDSLEEEGEDGLQLGPDSQAPIAPAQSRAAPRGGAAGGGGGAAAAAARWAPTRDAAAAFEEEEGEAEDEEEKPPRKMARREGGDAPYGPLQPTPGGDSWALHLPGPKWVAVGTYANKPRVDLRKCYEKDGVVMPSKDGLSIRPEEWDLLQPYVSDLGQALERRDVSFRVPLGPKARAAVSEYKGKYSVDIREVFEKKDGTGEGTTKRGCTFNADAWGQIIDALPHISRAVQDLKDGGLAAPQDPDAFRQARAAAGPGPGSAKAAAAAKPEAAGRGPAAAGAAAGRTGRTPLGEFYVELSDKLRVTVGKFKGSINVNIREFYEKDGQHLPGAKGLSMTLDQWALVADSAERVDEAVAGGKTDFFVELGRDRRLSLSSFKGTTYVGFREFYFDNNDKTMKPGKKGINIAADKWAVLRASIPAIKDAIRAA